MHSLRSHLLKTFFIESFIFCAVIFSFLKRYFGEPYCLLNKKFSSFVYLYLSSIAGFFKQLRQDTPYKAENWHDLSHQRYFSMHYFLDICLWVFNFCKHILSIVWGSNLEYTKHDYNWTNFTWCLYKKERALVNFSYFKPDLLTSV